ncbi:SAG-related sequence [Besnoitia besnoiti]|uniref:SAG-related sequence n=1 Tax=Besnoitia besnoiti TaxID=94643 RepID=A0A2A9MM68_BESBE|nr:SAG-related sequence [Besnoitia besnoiti]PFH36837.1 SAG-related sequence [Besnoitia besnoiti]
MAPVSALLCPLRQMFNGHRMRRKQSLGSLGNLATVLLVATVVAPLWPQYATATSPTRRDLARTDQSLCVQSGQKTTCICKDESAPSVAGTATISASVTTLHLQCKPSSLAYAPDGLSDATVCPVGTEQVYNCKAKNQGTKPCVALSTILVGNVTPAWTAETEAQDGTFKSLVVTKANLPFVDKQFVVGCVKEENAACTVAVAVNARPTEKTGQTVTCAYGENSNLTPQTVALNPSNRSFTLVCGEDGEVVPANYQASFCPVGAEKRDDQSGACTESYSQILPAYETSWWRNDGGKSSYTLTIPADKFPETEAKLNIRCQKKGASSSNRSEAPATPNPSVCSVDVTIEGVKASSSAPVGVWIGINFVSCFSVGAAVVVASLARML